jgi:hypothetical protein
MNRLFMIVSEPEQNWRSASLTNHLLGILQGGFTDVQDLKTILKRYQLGRKEMRKSNIIHCKK